MTLPEAVDYAMRSVQQPPLSPLNVWLCVLAAAALVALLMLLQQPECRTRATNICRTVCRKFTVWFG